MLIIHLDDSLMNFFFFKILTWGFKNWFWRERRAGSEIERETSIGCIQKCSDLDWTCHLGVCPYQNPTGNLLVHGTMLQPLGHTGLGSSMNLIAHNVVFQIILWRFSLSFQLGHIILEGKNYVLYCFFLVRSTVLDTYLTYLITCWSTIQLLSWCTKWWN